MPEEIYAKQRQRTDTAANWTANNPVLLDGEIGIESDTGKFKFGNGVTSWTSLAYTKQGGNGFVAALIFS